jgi:hypothetical protein
VPSTYSVAEYIRVFGFEIMPAPFVIAHMEIARLLIIGENSLMVR